MQLHECQIEGGAKENFDYAAVQLWTPASLHRIKAILCLVLHPLGRGGSKLAIPQPWIDLASGEGCALMAISFAQSDDYTRDWCQADRGTGRALFSALDELASKSGVANLRTAPVVVVGVCAAGQFAYLLAAYAPGRVSAFVTIGGGQHDLTKVRSAAKSSALVVVTVDRKPDAMKNLETLYALGRAEGAHWSRDYETITKYDHGMCGDMVISFIRSSLIGSEGTSAKREPVDTNTAPPVYKPFSICGEKLATFGRGVLSEIELGLIDKLASGPLTCKFTVKKEAGSPASDLRIVSRDEISCEQVTNLSSGDWEVTCTITRDALMEGALNLELPIRFVANGQPLLGGATVYLKGSVEGAVQYAPRSIALGILEKNHTTFAVISLSSRGKAPLIVENVVDLGSHKLIKDLQINTAQGSARIKLSFSPSPDLDEGSVKGILEIRCKSPDQERLRIFYYGSLKSRVPSGP